MSGAAVLVGVSVGAAVAAIAWISFAKVSREVIGRLANRAARPGALAREVFRDAFGTEEGIGDPSDRRRNMAVAVAAGALGFSLLGAAGAVLGVLLAPWVRTRVVRWRSARVTARIDEGCTEFALALSSALAAGNSVRGALLAAGPALEGPMAAEVDKLAVDITLGMSVEDAMAAMRDRTHSSRVEAVAGALALHRGSGGDLVLLMRELAAAFRGRDRAMREARSASVQARYTAAVVAAIPVAAGGLCELISPGSIAGTLTYMPTAVMFGLAIAGVAAGVVASWRIGSQ